MASTSLTSREVYALLASHCLVVAVGKEHSLLIELCQPHGDPVHATRQTFERAPLGMDPAFTGGYLLLHFRIIVRVQLL